MSNRRLFLSYLSSLGLATTIFPRLLWGTLQEHKAATVTKEMLRTSAAAAGWTFTDQQLDRMLEGVNRNLTSYEKLRQIQLDNRLPPPFYCNPEPPRRSRTASSRRMRLLPRD